MRERLNYIIITFDTTAQAIAMERYCGNQGIPGRLIPLPTSISAGCGISWRMRPEEFEEHKAELQALEYGQIANAVL